MNDDPSSDQHTYENVKLCHVWKTDILQSISAIDL